MNLIFMNRKHHHPVIREAITEMETHRISGLPVNDVDLYGQVVRLNMVKYEFDRFDTAGDAVFISSYVEPYSNNID